MAKAKLTNLLAPIEQHRSRFFSDLTQLVEPPSEAEILNPGYWTELSDKLAPSDTIVAKLSPGLEVELRVVATHSGGMVEVEKIGETRTDVRHICICRIDPDVLHRFTMAERQNGKWVPVWSGTNLLEHVVRAGLQHLVGKDKRTSDEWPDLSITGQDLASLNAGDAPPTTQAPNGWKRDQPMVIYAPVGNDPAGTLWSSVSRLSGHMVPGTRFRTPTVADRILSEHFWAGSTTLDGRQPRWKQLAAIPGDSRGSEMVIVRPRWRLCTLLPEHFPPPRPPVEIMSEEQKAINAAKDEYVGMREAGWAQKVSQGFSWSRDRQAWQPPREDE